MISAGKFEKLPPAIKAFNYALANLSVCDKFTMHRGLPGEVISSLPDAQRDALKGLTATLMNRYRFSPWQAHPYNLHDWNRFVREREVSQINRKLRQEFDQKILTNRKHVATACGAD
jgi:hypothetical protein